MDDLSKKDVFLGRSVENGIIRHTSISQISKFDDSVGDNGCQRRWAYEYIFGRKEEKSKKQLQGSEYASRLEHYLKSSEDVLPPVLQEGKKFFPLPGPDLEVEKPFAIDIEEAIRFREQYVEARQKNAPEQELVLLAKKIQDLAGLCAANVPLTGAADFRHRRGEFIDQEGVLRKEPSGIVVVETGDLKTTSRIFSHRTHDGKIFPGYAKTDAEVCEEKQMVAYGIYASHLYPDASHHRLSHIYCSTGVRSAAKRTGLVSVETLRQRWARVEGVVRHMEDVAWELNEGESRMREIRPHLSSCDAWNRPCPHRPYCPLPTSEAVQNLLGKEPSAMSLFDQLSTETVIETPSFSLPPTEEREAYEAKVKVEMEKLQKEDRGEKMIQGDKIPTTACDPGNQYFVDCADGSPPRAMLFHGTSALPKTGEIAYLFSDPLGGRVKLGGNDYVMEALSAPRISPPDAPEVDWIDAAAPLPAEVAARIEDPELKATVELHAKLHQERQIARGEGTKEKEGGRCPGGNQKVTLTVEQALKKKVVCAICGEERRVSKEVLAGGNLEVMVPGHNKPKGEKAVTEIGTNTGTNGTSAHQEIEPVKPTVFFAPTPPEAPAISSPPLPPPPPVLAPPAPPAPPTLLSPSNVATASDSVVLSMAEVDVLVSVLRKLLLARSAVVGV